MMSDNLEKDPLANIELATVTKEQISNVNYNLLKDLSEKLGISLEATFGVKKEVLVKEIWRGVCAKREQLEAGMTEEEIKADNERRAEERKKSQEAAKVAKEKEKEAEVQQVKEELERKPVTKEYALWAIERLETSLKVKKKTPGQRAATVKKLKNWNLKLQEIEKLEAEKGAE